MCTIEDKYKETLKTEQQWSRTMKKCTVNLIYNLSTIHVFCFKDNSVKHNHINNFTDPILCLQL